MPDDVPLFDAGPATHRRAPLGAVDVWVRVRVNLPDELYDATDPVPETRAGVDHHVGEWLWNIWLADVDGVDVDISRWSYAAGTDPDRVQRAIAEPQWVPIT